MSCVLPMTRPEPAVASRPRQLAAALGLTGLLALLPLTASALTLSEAWQLAASNDPVARATLATRDAERELGVQERATRLPGVNAQGSYSDTDSEVVSTPFGPGFSERYTGWQAGVELRQPLFRYDWLARGRRADARDQQAEAGFAQRQQALIARVAERYLAVLRAQNELGLAQAEAAAVRKSLEDTRKRYEVELIPGTDVKEAQARDDLSQAQLLAAQQALAAARDALAESTGDEASPLSTLTGTTDVGDDGIAMADWLARAREHSPALVQVRAAHAVARADLESRRSSALPVVDLVASHSRQDTSESRIGSEANSTVVGVEVNIPLFAGGGNLSRVREAQARLRVAEAERERVERELTRETRRLVRDVQTAQAQAMAFRRALESAESAERGTRYGYEAGKRTIVDVLNAQSATVQARRNHDNARFDVLLKRLQLRQQAGVLVPDDLAAIDRLLTPAS